MEVGMSKLALRGLLLGTVIALLGVASYAIAGGGTRNFKGDPLTGYAEIPNTLSTVATGKFSARVSDDRKSLHYKLTYSGLEGAVTQAHVHFGGPATAGGISYFLCGTAAAPGPAGTPACPTPGGTVEGDIDAADVLGPNSPPANQGIEPGAFNEILAAMRAGSAYANVHSTKWPAGEIRAQIKKGRGGDNGKGKRHDDDD
jgi:hypothetical protein